MEVKAGASAPPAAARPAAALPHPVCVAALGSEASDPRFTRSELLVVDEALGCRFPPGASRLYIRTVLLDFLVTLRAQDSSLRVERDRVLQLLDGLIASSSTSPAACSSREAAGVAARPRPGKQVAALP